MGRAVVLRQFIGAFALDIASRQSCGARRRVAARAGRRRRRPGRAGDAARAARRARSLRGGAVRRTQGGQRSLDFLQAGLPVLRGGAAGARTRGCASRAAATMVERGKLDEALARAAADGRARGWSPVATRSGPTGRFRSRSRSTRRAHAGQPRRRRRRPSGPKDDVARTALTAALDAFDAAAGCASPARRARRCSARFARDPYAFVLFSRGVAHGLRRASDRGATRRAAPASRALRRA